MVLKMASQNIRDMRCRKELESTSLISRKTCVKTMIKCIFVISLNHFESLNMIQIPRKIKSNLIAAVL